MWFALHICFLFRAELESHYASLIQKSEIQLRTAEERIEVSRRLNATVDETGAKVRKFKRGPDGLTSSNGITNAGDSRLFSSSKQEVATSPTTSFSPRLSDTVPEAVTGASDQASPDKGSSVVSQALEKSATTDLEGDDQPAILRAKYPHRSAPAMAPEECVSRLPYGKSLPVVWRNGVS